MFFLLEQYLGIYQLIAHKRTFISEAFIKMAHIRRLVHIDMYSRL